MSILSPSKLRSGKIIDNPRALEHSSEIHPTLDSDLNIANIADSDSKSSETHQNGNSLYSQAEMNGQFARLQAEMNENKGSLSTLTQQFTSRLEEGNALRASSSRNPERIDMVTGVSRTTHAAPMT